MVLSILVVAGWGEATLYRGFVFERLGKLFGQSNGAKAAIGAVSAGWFALAHYREQSIDGVKQATVLGLVFGAIFARTGQIWMLICAHAAFDLTALGLIYFNAEASVTHLIFR